MFKILRINDNLIKTSAADLISVLPLLKNLRVLDISDSLIGNVSSLEIFKALQTLPEIKEVSCNYNEIEEKSAQIEIFNICLTLNLTKLEIKGNEISKSVWNKYKQDLSNRYEKIDVYSEEEDGGDGK